MDPYGLKFPQESKVGVEKAEALTSGALEPGEKLAHRKSLTVLTAYLLVKFTCVYFLTFA